MDVREELQRINNLLDKFEQTTHSQTKPKRRRTRRRKKQRPYWYEDDIRDVQPEVFTSSQPRKPLICYRCGMEGHIAIGCRVRLDHCRRAYSFQQVESEDRTFAFLQQPSQKDTTALLGSPNEVSIKVNGVTATALLDTGSTVSTVSEAFYAQYLNDEDIQPLDTILKIECADGQDMPYLGYIAADIELPGSASATKPHTYLFLVVPDSSYNRQVPILLGTNVLKDAMEDVKLRFGTKFLQEANLHSPYFLMFGRHPRLPVDIAFGLDTHASKEPSTKYAEAMKDRLKKAYELATISAKKAQGRQKEGYDKRVRGAVLQPGDRVLVKVVAFDGKHKLADKWEEDTYRIIRQPNDDIPVFVVQKENGEGRKRTLHRNLLLPIGHLQGFEKEKPAPRKRLTRVKPTLEEEQTKADSSSDSTETETDEESEQGYMVLLPDEGTQSNANGDAVPVIERQPESVNMDDDDQARVDGYQGIDIGEDAFPPVDRKAGESLLDADVVTGEEAMDQQQDRADTLQERDDADLTLPGTSGDTEADEVSVEAPITPRRRRILPTPPRDPPEPRQQRIRRPPTYLKDYVTKQAVGKPSWQLKVDWLMGQLERGMFKGMENEISRTILKIVEGSP